MNVGIVLMVGAVAVYGGIAGYKTTGGYKESQCTLLLNSNSTMEFITSNVVEVESGLFAVKYDLKDGYVVAHDVATRYCAVENGTVAVSKRESAIRRFIDTGEL